MAKLKIGDKIHCKIHLCNIVSSYQEEFDSIQKFEIISVDNSGYYIYIPHYIYIKGGNKLNSYNCREFKINNKFIDEISYYITDSYIFKTEIIKENAICINCKEPFEWANSEELDFICYSCKQNPYR